jgi:hypothetical protein
LRTLRTGSFRTGTSRDRACAFGLLKVNAQPPQRKILKSPVPKV